MADFPIPEKQDAQFFAEDYEDPAIRSEMEGGYVVTRPRHTRPPRRTWTTGFTSLSNDDKVTLETFYRDRKGGSEAFNWENPADGEVYVVRFVEKMQFRWAGVGETKLWDVPSIKLEEV